MNLLPRVTRVEVIDPNGRSYVYWPPEDRVPIVSISYQDDGRTLKVFIAERTPKSLRHSESKEK